MKNDAKFEKELNDTKFWEESTRCFKIGVRNLTNFDLSAY